MTKTRFRKTANGVTVSVDTESMEIVISNKRSESITLTVLEAIQMVQTLKEGMAIE